MLIGPSHHHRARPSPLNFKNEYLVLELREETVVQAVGLALSSGRPVG